MSGVVHIRHYNGAHPLMITPWRTFCGKLTGVGGDTTGRTVTRSERGAATCRTCLNSCRPIT